MRIAFGFIGFLLISYSAQSQVDEFHQFVDTGAVWRIDEIDNSAPVWPYYYLSYYQYLSYGDTIVNGSVWIKIYVSGAFNVNSSAPFFIQPPGILRGLIRTDSLYRKMYVYVDTTCFNCDSLEYDFTLNTGDTMYPQHPGNFFGCGDTMIIGSVDSVIVGSSYRKRLNVFDYHVGSFNGVSLIDGIGSTQGLFEGYSFFEQHYNLICYSVFGTPLYPDTVSTCTIINDLQTITGQNSTIGICPNPAIDNIRVGLENGEIKSLCIYNLMGKPILTLNNIGGSWLSISVDNFNSGIYIVKAIDGFNIAQFARLTITK